MSLRFPFLLALIVTLFAGCGPQQEVSLDYSEISGQDQPIIKGSVASPTQFRGVGALVVYNASSYSPFCTGILISSRLVLTAAHCLTKIQPKIKPGESVGFSYAPDLSAAGAFSKIVAVEKMTAHPSFPKSGTPPGALADYYDIAVVKLKTALNVPWERMISPTDAKTALKLTRGVLIMGYGLTNASVKTSGGVKHWGSATIGKVGSSEIWLNGATKYPQKCSGDSGGPTLVDVHPAPNIKSWRLVGVASRTGVDCTLGSIETRVDTYLKWIHSFGPIPCSSGLSSSCSPPLKSIGAACTTNGECKDGLCVTAYGKKVCAKACTSGASCPSGYSCVTNASKQVCLKSSTIPKAKLGEACTKNDDCDSKVCVNSGGKLVCSAYCSTTSQDCPSGYTCIAISGNTKGACVKTAPPPPPPPPPPPKGDPGDPCANAGECSSGICGSFDGTKYCTKICLPTSKDACGAKMECIPAGGGKYVCAKSEVVEPEEGVTDRSGCDIPGGTRDGLPAMALLLLGLALARRRSC